MKSVARKSCGTSDVPLLPDSSGEFHDSFVPSETAGPLVLSTNVMSEAFSVKRLPGSRDHKGSHDYVWKRVFSRGSNVLFDGLRQKKATANEHHPPSGGKRRWENGVMDEEKSLHQKAREICITEDTESINLEWFDKKKLNRTKNGARCLLQGWRS